MLESSSVPTLRILRNFLLWCRPQAWCFGLCWCALCVKRLLRWWATSRTFPLIVNRRTRLLYTLSQVLLRLAVHRPGGRAVSPLHLSRAPSIPDPFSLTPSASWLLQPVAPYGCDGKEASYASL